MASFASLSGIPPLENEVRLNPFSPVSIDAVDSVMARLDDNERIAQLFVIRNSQPDELYAGGFLFNDIDNIHLTSIKDPNGISYLVGYDMLQAKNQFASEQQLAQSNDFELVSRYTSAVGNFLAQLDVNFVLGPALDLYQNDMNHSTVNHSFSDNAKITLSFASASVRGFNQAGILSVVGSYPGIGSAKQSIESDSPTLFARSNQLYSNEMIPFKGLVNTGIQNIMIGNVHVPAIDSGTNFLASQSPEVNDILRNKLEFNGLAWTDISNQESEFNGDATSAIIAGNDIVIIDGNLRQNIKKVNESIDAGKLNRQLIDQKCKRIIQAKLWSGKNQPKKKDSAVAEMELILANRAVTDASLTLLRNQNERIPLRNLDTLKIALINISENPEAFNSDWIQRYSSADFFTIRLNHLEEDYSAFQRKQKEYNLVILLGAPETNLQRKRFGIGEHYQSVIERISIQQPTIFAWYGNTKALLYVSNTPSLECVISGHEPIPLSMNLTVQKVFGGRPFTGRLKRKVGNQYEREFGIDTEKTRLAYGLPEEVGIKSEYLSPISTIVRNAIEEKACPGSQVWFAKDGMVVVNEAFGHHRYDARDTVRWNDLYDLASITKIAGSVAGLMKLTQDSLFNLDHNLCDYLDEWVDTTEFMNMGMREIFAHQAGLPAFIPFYASTLQKGVPRYDIYSIAQKRNISVKSGTWAIHKV